MNKHKTTSLTVLITLTLLASACVTSSRHYRLGREAMKSGQFDRSIEYFETALAEFPQKTEVRTMLFQARLNSYYQHLQTAREKRAVGDREAALASYNRALEIFPGNQKLQQEIDAYTGSAPAKPEREFVSEIAAPVALALDGQEKISIRLRNTPVSTIFKSVGRSFQVNVLFDKDFRDFSYTLEVENLGFYEIINQLCLISNSQYRVLDAASILVFPNVLNKKREFELRGIKTFFLSNIRAEEAKKTITAVFRDQQPLVQEEINLNALIVRADISTLQEIERFLYTIDMERNEVEIDVEILEINRSLINKIGADFGANAYGLAAGQVGGEGEINQTINLKDITSTNFFLTVPSAALHLLASSDDNKIIAKPNMRGVEGEEISFMVGDEVPIPETQFGSIAAGGVNTVPTTTYRYKNIGVEIKMTPFIHDNNEVTLQIELNIQFIASYVGNFPILGKREIKNTIRLKEGETNIIGGLIRDDVRGSLSGFPLLAKIPLLGKLFGASENNIRQTDLIFSVTPRIIRKSEPGELKRETIWSGIVHSAPMELSQSDPADLRRRITEAVALDNRENVLTISPAVGRFPVNAESQLTVILSSDIEIATISLSGSIRGAEVEILDLRTDFLGIDEASQLKNISGQSFDIGMTFITPRKINKIPILQVKTHFLKVGKAVFSIDRITAYGPNRQPINLRPASSHIEIY